MENIIISPISDLRIKLSEISKVIHKSNKPLFLTKNGYGDMVIMSLHHYQEILDESEVYLKTKEAEIYV